MVYPVTHYGTVTDTSIFVAPGLDFFLRLFQSIIFLPFFSTSGHLEIVLLHDLSSQGFPVVVGDTWLLQTNQVAILQVPYISTLDTDATYFYWEDLAKRMGHGFSLLLSTANIIKLFGTRLQISRLISFPQENRSERLICDSKAPPPIGDSPLPQFLRHHHFTDIPPTLVVNNSNDKS